MSQNVLQSRLDAKNARVNKLVWFFAVCVITLALIIILVYKPWFTDRHALDFLCYALFVVVVVCGVTAILLIDVKKKMVEGRIDKVFLGFFKFDGHMNNLDDFSTQAEERVIRMVREEARLLAKAFELKDSLEKLSFNDPKLEKHFSAFRRALQAKLSRLFDAYDSAMAHNYIRRVLKVRNLEALLEL